MAAVAVLRRATPAQSAAAFTTAAAIAAAGLIPAFEGKVNHAYWDATGKIWTICYGRTLGVKEGDRASDEQCVRWAAEDAVRHGVAISRCVVVEVPLASAVAFISFAYNVGVAAFCRSTLVKKLNAGDLAGACRQLNRSDTGKEQWVFSGGVRLRGLVKRRAAERAYCERGLA